MRKALVLLLVILGISLAAATLLFILSYPLSAEATPPKPALGRTEQTLLEATNNERVQAGLSALQLDSALSASASAKCTDMVTDAYWEHVSPDGTQWYSFVQATTAYISAGENLAKGYTTTPDTISAWMNSPAHRDNILNPDFDRIGFAFCATPAYPDMVVQHFTNVQ